MGSVDVPILASRKYRAIRSEFKNGCASAYMVEMTQKMVVVKSKTNDDKAQYLLTLIPDRDYYAKNKGDISSKFLNSGDKGRYSGYALYTYNGFPVRLNKYRDGEKTEGITIIGITDRVELFNRFSVIHKKIGEIQIQYQNAATLTRVGGEDEWQTDDDWWYQNGTFFIDNDGNIFIDNDGDGIPDSVWIPPVIVDPDSESDNNGDSYDWTNWDDWTEDELDEYFDQQGGDSTTDSDDNNQDSTEITDEEALKNGEEAVSVYKVSIESNKDAIEATLLTLGITLNYNGFVSSVANLVSTSSIAVRNFGYAVSGAGFVVGLAQGYLAITDDDALTIGEWGGIISTGLATICVAHIMFPLIIPLSVTAASSIGIASGTIGFISTFITRTNSSEMQLVEIDLDNGKKVYILVGI